MKTYSIKELALSAKITVRTLQYYDEIGLLNPHRRKNNNYRFYGDLERLKLQQILFFRELGYPLSKIKFFINSSSFDLRDSLKMQRKKLSYKKQKLNLLIKTLDQTLINLNNITNMTNDELYDGFLPDNNYREESIDKWGAEEVKKSEEQIKKLGKAQWKALKNEGHLITEKLADMMDLEPSSQEVQRAIKSYHQHLGNFYKVSLSRFRALGGMYVSDERFTAYYEKYKNGLANFINEAIKIYCQKMKI